MSTSRETSVATTTTSTSPGSDATSNADTEMRDDDFHSVKHTIASMECVRAEGQMEALMACRDKMVELDEESEPHSPRKETRSYIS
jgi:hypothetical protein